MCVAVCACVCVCGWARTTDLAQNAYSTLDMTSVVSCVWRATGLEVEMNGSTNSREDSSLVARLVFTFKDRPDFKICFY